VEDGEIRWDEMRKSHISKDDLLSALRLNDSTADTSELNRPGSNETAISAFEAEAGPKVVEVKVESGVQTIHVEVQ
jgi:hypothetical protein